ncbi:MAG: hypothetical protein EXR80_00605 [Methylococcales bacterium]|nr:hypothetical protein [Methylococcales bacterium]
MEKSKKVSKVLKDVSVITKQFNDKQKASGELFNIFSITKIERVEVNTHSAMIAELVNPSGSHGQDDKCLILFLKIAIPTLLFTGTEKAKVFKEKSFAPLGRVDILIELEKDVFLIENKIDAKDGNKQLERYAKILTSFEGKNWHLLYLTKFGTEAEESSHCGVKYQRISYREQILDWLDSCIKQVDSIPAIKHTLLQYQYLIKKITGTSMTHEMKKELVDLLMEGDNFQAAQAISGVIRLTKGEILFKFFQNVENTIKKQPDVVSAIKGSFPELEYYNKNRCINWFSTKKGIKTHSIGVFF